MSRCTGHRAVRIAGAALWIAAWLMTPAGAAGGFRPRIAAQTDSVSGAVVTTITVNDQPAITLKTSDGGHGPEVRGQIVADRLTALIASGLMPGDVSVRHLSRGTWAVTALQSTLLLVTRDEAAAHQESAKALAHEWAATLRKLLEEPAISVSPADSLIVPYQETRTIIVGGAASAGDIVAQDTDARITQTKFDPTARTLTVRGLSPGKAAVNLQAGSVTVSIPVDVMQYAAAVAPALTVAVTGDPAAPPTVVNQAVYTGLAQVVDAQPGAQMHLGASPKIAVPLPVGESLTVSLPLRVAGPGLLPIETKIAITVANQALQFRPAKALFYSNNPEQVKQPQTLFSGRLEPLQPVRLDYHHQNDSGAMLVFHADLINDSAVPATVHVISGIALPGADTVQVGRRAGASFLRAFDNDAGILIQIPPHSRVPLVTQRFAPGLTVSGIVQMQQTDGQNDAVSLDVSADGDQTALVSPVARLIFAALPDNRSAAPLPDMPTDYGDGTRLPTPSPYVFGAPQIAKTESYSVGGRWTYIRIGHKGLQDSTGKYTLWGNYGAVYHISLTLTNPTSKTSPVGIFFAPEAGSAAGVFRVDSDPIQEYDPTPPPQEVQLTKYDLAPGETRVVQIETIPLNGSSYPASIIAHAL